MAVWLTMNMSYVGPGDSANTSKVAVTVNVHWSHVSYNRDGGSLVVTVDGVADRRSAPFNAGETSSGTQTIYSSYWNISQPNGAAKTVSASATFQATNQTTATPASASLSLAALSGSGGGNTGGNEGGNTGGDSGGNEGGNTGGSGSLPEIYPDYLPSNVSDVGQAYIAESTSGELAYNDISTCYFSWNDPLMNSAIIIKFLAPSFSGVSSYLSVKLSNNRVLSDTVLVNFALCTSDENYSLYYGAKSNVDDPMQIASGTTTNHSLIDGFSIYTDRLESLKYYYLVLWFSSDIEEYVRVHLNGARYHGLTLYSTTDSGGGSGGDVVTPSTRGVFYIDNGTEYAEYECYIDNCTGWDLLGGGSTGESEYYRKEGTVRTDGSGGGTPVSVNCGFAPDLVVLHLNENESGVVFSSAASFDVHNGPVVTATYSLAMNGNVSLYVDRDDQGFLVISYFENQSNPFSLTLNYVAIKYT